MIRVRMAENVFQLKLVTTANVRMESEEKTVNTSWTRADVLPPRNGTTTLSTTEHAAQEPKAVRICYEVGTSAFATIKSAMLTILTNSATVKSDPTKPTRSPCSRDYKTDGTS